MSTCGCGDPGCNPFSLFGEEDRPENNREAIDLVLWKIQENHNDWAEWFEFHRSEGDIIQYLKYMGWSQEECIYEVDKPTASSYNIA